MRLDSLINRAVFFVILLMLISCGSKPVSLEDIEAYPGATVLKAGESNLGDTLAKNVKTHGDIKESMGPLASGTQLDQRGFQLPQDAQWKDVRKFYEESLKKAGWTVGLGGVAGQFMDVNKAMNAGQDENSLTHSMLFSKGNQRLTVIMTASPVNKNDKTLVLSLSSN